MLNFPKVDDSVGSTGVVIAVVVFLCGLGCGVLSYINFFAPHLISDCSTFAGLATLGLSVFSFIASAAVVFEKDGNCHYCCKPTRCYQAYMLVTWPEKTKYSGQQTEAKVYIHTACHKSASADKKFHIPVPEFKDIEI